MTELEIRLKDESKLDALLYALRSFTASEGVDLAVDSLERHTVIAPLRADLDWDKWDAIMSRDKLQLGQSVMQPQAEEKWIAAQLMEIRADERVQ